MVPVTPLAVIKVADVVIVKCFGMIGMEMAKSNLEENCGVFVRLEKGVKSA